MGNECSSSNTFCANSEAVIGSDGNQMIITKNNKCDIKLDPLKAPKKIMSTE